MAIATSPDPGGYVREVTLDKRSLWTWPRSLNLSPGVGNGGKTPCTREQSVCASLTCTLLYLALQMAPCGRDGFQRYKDPKTWGAGQSQTPQ